MLMHEAMRIINDEPKPMGYMVSFERKEGRFLAGDHFPDKHRGEPLILDYGADIKTPEQWAGEVRGGRPVRPNA